MLLHPEMTLIHAHARQSDLIAEADRYRLLAAARRYRRASRAGRGQVNAEARGRPTGTLAPCEPRVAVPARS
jgi:hypothetical protein